MSADELLARLLLDLAILLGVAQVLRLLLARLHQPTVLAEVLAGIALGPSLLGQFPSDPSAFLFPDEVRSVFTLVGTLGLIMFGFTIGLDLDLRAVRGRARAVAGVSAGALLVPLTAGALLAVALYPAHGEVGGEAIPFAAFVLFLATSMAVTAFPVLVAILAERGIRRSPLGEIAVGSAAIQDGVGWLLLAAALATLSAGAGAQIGWMVLEIAAFAAILFGVARPVLQALLSRAAAAGRSGGADVLAYAVPYAIACAGLTQLIGLHALIGAFVAGLAFPRGEGRAHAHAVVGAVMPVTLAVFLPIYFLTPGLRLEVGGIGGDGLLELAAIVAVACSSKFAGAALPARASGMGWGEASTLGVLLNTRGLMELVVLTVGYDQGVLDQNLFSIWVIMAIITTMMTGPLLDRLRHRGVTVAGERGGASRATGWDWEDPPAHEPAVGLAR